MDFSKLIQDNAGVIGAVVGFVAAQLVQIWRDQVAERRAIGREARIDRRALRDTKLARMRLAFLPVVLAARALLTAAHEYFVSAGNPAETSALILEKNLGPIDQARAQLVLEGDLDDISDELAKMRTAFNAIGLAFARNDEGPVGKHFNELEGAYDRLVELVRQHLDAVERSI